MPKACPNYWQEYGCDWNIRYLWHWTNRYARLDIVVLALLLTYILVVAIRVSHRYHLARRAQGMGNGSQSPRELAIDLTIEVGGLRSVAFIAPYLGLAGTCLGLLNMFGAFAMEKHALQAMLVSKAAAALLPTAAGILVAVPATCLHNYLRTRIDILQHEMSDEALAQTRAAFCKAQTLPLKKRFSDFPAFALIAAPVLALLGGALIPLFSFHTPTGLAVDLAPARCVDDDGEGRLIVLHVTDAGKVFLNLEKQDWNSLAPRLAEIYGTRVHRNLYLLADGGIPFRTVADAIDIVKNAPVTSNPDSRNITVKLITPEAINAPCPQPVAAPSSIHAMK